LRDSQKVFLRRHFGSRKYFDFLSDINRLCLTRKPAVQRLNNRLINLTQQRLGAASAYLLMPVSASLRPADFSPSRPPLGEAVNVP
jgi:hypothetical protein